MKDNGKMFHPYEDKTVVIQTATWRSSYLDLRTDLALDVEIAKTRLYHNKKAPGVINLSNTMNHTF